MTAISELSKKTVSYFSDEDISIHCLCGPNPMRPLRVKLTNKLVEGYQLDRKMIMHRPRQLSFEELNMFHADEYVEFLSKVTPRNVAEYKQQMDRFNLGVPGEADCPVFEGVFKYCQLYCGGSRDAALNLMSGDSQIAFNWSGGMHHAKRAEASGFCYVNDIVLAILELLKHYHRVLYVDIDIHHGDGVEEAFYLTDRVMTVSFHKYGDFFPGTGALEDVGHFKGIHYSVNVPLAEGMDDDSYQLIYEPVMQKVMEVFQPGAIVVCAGADSLSGDRLGCFNLSLQGHSRCLELLAHYDVPLLVLGGGGYTMRNVSRCWAFETARLQGIDPDDDLPEAFLQEHNYYMDTRRLRIDTSNMMNMNSRVNLLDIRDQVLKNLSQLQPPSGAAISNQPAPGKLPDTPEPDPDVRGGGQDLDDLRAVRDGYDSDEEGTGNRVLERGPTRRAAGAAAEGAAGSATGSGTGGGAVVAESGGRGGADDAPAVAEVDGGAVDVEARSMSAPSEGLARPNGEGLDKMYVETGAVDLTAGTVELGTGSADAPRAGIVGGGSTGQGASGAGHARGMQSAGGV